MQSYKHKQIPTGTLTLDTNFVANVLPLFTSELLAVSGQGSTQPAQAANTGGWIEVDDAFSFCFCIRWTGTPTGNFVLEGTNDGKTAYVISGTSQAAGGAAGTFAWERLTQSGFKYVRFNYQFASSTGTLTEYNFHATTLRDN